MELSVKNVKLHEDMSEETNCFSADLYDNGKLVAHVKNDGWGGSNMVYPAKGLKYDDIRQYDNMDVEVIIDQLVIEYDTVTKYQNKGLILREINPKGDKYPHIMLHEWIDRKSTAQHKKSPSFPLWLENQKKKFKKDGYEIINRNL